LSILDSVYETSRRSDVETAMREFGTAMGIPGRPELPPGVELPPEMTEVLTRIQGNLGYWIEHELRQYPRHSPDLGALASKKDRLILAGGEDSREFFPYFPNTVLAERFGLPVADLPGGHIGYLTHPPEFATHLAKLLPGK
jgi:acetyltransferase/esterase